MPRPGPYPSGVVPRAQARAGAAAILAGLLLAASSAVGALAGGPVATVAPSVIGSATAGKELSGLSGSWAGFGAITYRFRWYRCNAAGANCASIAGAASPTFSLGNADVGKTLGLTVYATDSTGTTAAYASLVGPIAPRRPLLESTAQPVVTGPPVAGKVIQVTTGTWSPVPAGLSYQWERCNANGRVCAAIANANRSDYTPTTRRPRTRAARDRPGRERRHDAGRLQHRDPRRRRRLGAGPAPTIGPSVTGYAIEGQALSAQAGIWKGVGSVLFAFRWYRCDADGGGCRPIPNATQSIYTTTPKDVGATVGLSLTASDSTGQALAYASLVGPVAAASAPLTPTTSPTISGTARVGGTLSADYGTWSTRPSVFTVSWLRCNRNGRLCSPVAGATGPAYRPTAADRGHTLVVAVAATAAGASQAALSAATAPIVG